MRSRIFAPLWLAGALALLVAARPVAAHSELVAAEPAPGAQLAESPAEIRLTFSEPVSASSQIVLLDEQIQSVEGLMPQFDPARPEEVYTPLPPLEPGVYSVQWVAVSEDGHQISGSYSFGVGVAAPGAVTADAAEPEAAQSMGVGWWWIIALIVLAVGLPLALLVARRGKRPAGS